MMHGPLFSLRRRDVFALTSRPALRSPRLGAAYPRWGPWPPTPWPLAAVGTLRLVRLPCDAHDLQLPRFSVSMFSASPRRPRTPQGQAGRPFSPSPAALPGGLAAASSRGAFLDERTAHEGAVHERPAVLPTPAPVSSRDTSPAFFPLFTLSQRAENAPRGGRAAGVPWPPR